MNARNKMPTKAGAEVALVGRLNGASLVLSLPIGLRSIDIDRFSKRLLMV